MTVGPCRAYLREAVESALSEPCDLFVMYDGPRPPILPDFMAGPRVRVEGLQRREGRATALQRCFEWAALEGGEWIGMFDADDRLVHGAVAETLRAIHRKRLACDPGLVVTGWHRIDQQGRRYRQHLPVRPESGWAPIGAGLRLFHRDVLSAIGGVDESYTAAMDVDLMLRAGEQFDVLAVDHALLEYRRNPKSISSTRRSDQLRHQARAYEASRQRRAVACL